MASNKRTIYLGLDYSNFTGGVTEVNRKMSLLDAEFKRAQEEAKLYGNETDSLGLKHDMLSQKIALQKKKVEEAEKAYNAAMSSQNKSQKVIDATDKKLLNERTTLLKLENQLKETDKAQEELTKDSQSFGDVIRNVADSIGISANPMVEKLAEKFDGVSAAAGASVIALGAIVGGLVSCSKELATTSDDLLTMASTTGMTTDELQKLQYASGFVDVSVETMSSSITKLTSNMDKARNGSKDMQEAFNKLHIKVTDGNGALRDANDIFYEAIDRLGKVRNETERDALAMTLFGKSAKELNPLIEAGSDRLKELGIEAENMGVILSEDALVAGGALNDALERMEISTNSLKLQLGQALLPILTKVVDKVTDAVSWFNNLDETTKKIIAGIAIAIPAIVVLSSTVRTFAATMTAITAIQGAFNTVSLKTVLIIAMIGVAIAGVIALVKLLSSTEAEADRTAAKAQQYATAANDAAASAQKSTYSASNHATGTTNFKGGRTWVGEAGPELVTLPRGSQITPATASSEVNYWNVTIDAKNVSDFNRVVEMAQAQRMAVRRV